MSLTCFLTLSCKTTMLGKKPILYILSAYNCVAEWLEKCTQSCRLLSLYMIIKVRVGPKDQSYYICLVHSLSQCPEKHFPFFSRHKNPPYSHHLLMIFVSILVWKGKQLGENATTTHPPLYLLLQNMYGLHFYLRWTISFVHPIPRLLANEDISPAILNSLSCITNILLIIGYSQWHKPIWFLPS